jgi:hypothetical protein
VRLKTYICPHAEGSLDRSPDRVLPPTSSHLLPEVASGVLGLGQREERARRLQTHE